MLVEFCFHELQYCYYMIFLLLVECFSFNINFFINHFFNIIIMKINQDFVGILCSYLQYFPRNKPSKSDTVGSGWF